MHQADVQAALEIGIAIIALEQFQQVALLRRLQPFDAGARAADHLHQLRVTLDVGIELVDDMVGFGRDDGQQRLERRHIVLAEIHEGLHLGLVRRVHAHHLRQ